MPLSDDDLKLIKDRLEKLERGSRATLLMQVLAAPLILAGITFFFNLKIEETKSSFNKLEQEAKRVDALRGMLPELFSETPDRALIAEQIVGTIADNDSKTKIHEAVTTWVKTKLDAALLTTRTDPKSAAAISQIRATAKQVQSSSATDVKNYIGAKNFYTVVVSEPQKNQAITWCKRFRSLGYDASVYSTTNDVFAVAISVVASLNDAQQTGRDAVAKGHAKEFFVLPSKYVEDKVFP